MRKIRLTPTDLREGVVLSHYSLKIKPLSKIENDWQWLFQEYAQEGYNSFTFDRETGTVSIRKIDPSNYHETDIYGGMRGYY